MTSPRPVSLFTIAFVLALFAAFFFVVRYYYKPTTTPAYVSKPDNMSKDLEWRSTRDARQKTLQDIRKQDTDGARGYGWVDQKAGVVRLPIDRAIDLTVQQYGKKQ